MKTIQIIITVPDDVEIKVGGSAPKGTSKPFVPRPDPEYPDAPCPECGGGWRLIKGGFSKTKTNEDGTPKQFNSFYVCQTDGCDGKPGRETVIEDVTGMPF